MRTRLRTPGQLAERALWESRLVVLVAVVGSLCLSLATFLTATVDAFYLVGKALSYASPSISGEARSLLQRELLTGTVGIVDGYLVATVLLVFALGLYELFVGKLEPAQESENAESVLLIRTLDDLKDRLAKVVQLVLVIEFFKQVLLLKLGSSTDLFLLAASILFVSVAIYLLTRAKR
jgi:uncharacterized membrane protein YqhA